MFKNLNKNVIIIAFSFLLTKFLEFGAKIQSEIHNDIFSIILNPIKEFLNTIGLTHISAIEFNILGNLLGKGFAPADNTLNFLITYMPLFAIILALFANPKLLITIFKKITNIFNFLFKKLNNFYDLILLSFANIVFGK